MAGEAIWGLAARGGYVFVIAVFLALLEVQIEGAHGWAARLPTWRLDGRWALRLFGKPVTGYHVFLQMFILGVLHLPVVYVGFSAALEAEVMTIFFMLAVFWDFFWFALNPHYGLRRFRKGEVWWYKVWIAGLPSAYYSGLAMSAGAATAPAMFGAETWAAGAARWGVLFGVFFGLTLAAVLVSSAIFGAVRARRGRGGRSAAASEEISG